jgi:hypothetical protein
MSFWNVPDSDYVELAVATPGWQTAPVPGWGINPLRAGPMRVGIGLGQSIPGEDDFLPHWAALGADPEAAYKETSWGVVAGAAALGIGLGLLFGYGWWGGKRLTPNKSRRRSRRKGGKMRRNGYISSQGWGVVSAGQFDPVTGEAYRVPHVRARSRANDWSAPAYPDTKAGLRRLINDANAGRF